MAEPFSTAEQPTRRRRRGRTPSLATPTSSSLGPATVDWSPKPQRERSLVQLLLLSSKSSTAALDSTYSTGRVSWSFRSPLVAPSAGYRAVMAVESAAVPRSWYVINSYNNTFTFSSSAGSGAVTITPGNYNAIQLALAVQTAVRALAGGLSSFSCTYDNITNKLQMSLAVTFTVSGVSTATARWLGFSRGVTSVSASFSPGPALYVLSPPQVLDLSYTKTLRIVSNIHSMTMAQQGNEQQDSVRGTIAVMNVSVAPQGIILYRPQVPDEHVLARNTVEGLTFTLADDDGNVIEMNGGDYELLVQVRFEAGETDTAPSALTLAAGAFVN